MCCVYWITFDLQLIFVLFFFNFFLFDIVCADTHLIRFSIDFCLFFFCDSASCWLRFSSFICEYFYRIENAENR